MLRRMRVYLVLLLTVLVLPHSAQGDVSSDDPNAQAGKARPASPPLFIENVGQFDEGARFQMWGGVGTTWLAEDGLWITLVEAPSRERLDGRDRLRGLDGPMAEALDDEPTRAVHLKLSFVGANPHPLLEPYGRAETVVSYFIGADRDGWHADVPVWTGVRYVDLYPGVDLLVGDDDAGQVDASLPWRLVVREGVRQVDALRDVRLRVEGAEAVTIDGDALRLVTAVGEIHLPLAQFPAARRQEGGHAVVEPAITGGGHVIAVPFSTGVKLPDGNASLADNPGDLIYATFLGGREYDSGSGIALDGAGCAYVTGSTESSDFPADAGSGYDTSLSGSYDAFVVKLDASGTTLAYATFLGGEDDDFGRDIALDEAGCAYVTGRTESSDFCASQGPGYDTSYHGGYSGDAFVVKLNASGTALDYATFLGESNSDYGEGIAVDGAGCAHVIGDTQSSDFPAVLGPGYDTSYNGGFRDAFVVKLNAGGTALAYATFLGGEDSDHGAGIALDATGCAYVTGSTASGDFPAVLGPGYDTSYNGGDDRYRGYLGDAFLVKLSVSGTALVYATFLGGEDPDHGEGIAVDGAGCAYVTGDTQSSEFPAALGPGYDTNSYDRDAFVVKLRLDATPVETPTATATATATPTPAPTAAPRTLERRYCSGDGDLVYRLDSSAFRPYGSDHASDATLIEVTSPPAPASWNQPAFVPGAGWGSAVPVWWDHWESWTVWPYDGVRIGVADGQGAYGVDGTTHLIRRTFDLTPPYPDWHIIAAELAMWSDNKTAWWWQGERIATDREGLVGEMALYPDRVAAEGGRYLLAVQNSNDFVEHENPQGTAYQLTVTWEGVLPPLCLPLVLR